jgi:pyruvate dehydrogenase E2 component (dihydrolipoamide acetyltransferase)
MAYEFRFPDIGEGITEGELLSWKVEEGDQVGQDETLAEMETDKAVVEMPSPRAGRIMKLHAAAGDIVNVGDVLVTIEEEAGEPAARRTPAQPAAAAAEPVPAPAGTGRPAAVPAPAPTPAGEAEPYTGSVVGRLEEAPEEEEAVRRPEGIAAPEEEPGVLAMPSVRALARELGVDLKGLRGTGPGGRIIKQDVEDVAQSMAYAAAGPAPTGAAPVVPAAGAPATAAAPPPGQTPAPATQQPETRRPEVPGAAEVPQAPAQAVRICIEEAELAPIMGGAMESDGHGPVERVLFRGVRRSMARRMSEAVAKQAQVTTMDEADVTVIKRIREKERTIAAERGVRLTYLAFVVKACTASLKRFPRLNAVLDESGDEFLLKRYYNIGIAIDTRSGLMVPNIKDADRKSIFQIAEEIVDLVDRAEQRQIDLQGFRGGTFSITNYGAIGGLYATPVINYPEVAILGMGRVKENPIVRDGRMDTRLLLPLALTFDHRLVDGAEAARFLNLVIGYLEDPDLLLLEGA